MWDLFLAGIPPPSYGLLPGGSNDADCWRQDSWFNRTQHAIFFRGRTFDLKAMKKNVFIPSKLVSHERVLMQTCHGWMCGSERVWDHSLSSGSQASAPHSQWLTCSRAWPALPCKWHGSARSDAVWRIVKEKECLRDETHVLLHSCKHGICVCFGFSQVLSPSDWYRAARLWSPWPLTPFYMAIPVWPCIQYWNKITWLVTRHVFGEVYQVKGSLKWDTCAVIGKYTLHHAVIWHFGGRLGRVWQALWSSLCLAVSDRSRGCTGAKG